MVSPMVVNAAELITILSAAALKFEPVLVTGMPGVGKTDICRSVADSLNYDFVLSHPAVEDPTTPGGLPWIVDGKAIFLPLGIFDRLINATRPTLWLIDDLGQAAPAVQAVYMQWLLAREVNGHKLPDCVSIVSCSNRRVDRSGVTGILESVKSRFITILEYQPSIEDWRGWAYAHLIEPLYIAFLAFRPDLLCAFSPTADLTNSPVPRTHAAAARILKLGLPESIEVKMLAGAVGQGCATEFMSFRRLAQQIGSVDSVLNDPAGAVIPSNTSALWAICIGLAARATPKNFKDILVYLERLVAERHGEFAALVVKDAVKRDPSIGHTQSFVKMSTGPVGVVYQGAIAQRGSN